MAQANIRAVITAEDNASKVVSSFGANVDKTNKGVVAGNQKSAVSFNQVLVATAGLSIATKGLLGVIDDSVGAANKYQNALLGLSSIAKAFGHNVDQAKQAANDLAKDGLLTVADAARGLKNLLQSGFSLPEATKLMERFKDSAAFGRQSALSFGDAVASATEGIKNGNSILVDNAGVTKNLSIILEEAGFSAQDLMKATTDVNVRQALFNGIIKETNANVGDAARLTETYAGGQARLTAKTTELKQTIGESLQPALTKLLDTITPMVDKFAKFAEDHPKITAAMLLITTAGLGLLAVLGTIGLAVQGLGPIFTTFGVVGSGALGAVKAAAIATSGSISALGAVIAGSSLAIGGLVAAAGFAVYKMYELKKAFDDTNRSITNTNKALDSTEAALSKAREQYQAGKITKERYNAILGGAYASGGFTGRGAADEIAGIVHKGEYVLPQSQVDQTTGLPKMGGGGTVNINVNVGMYAGTEMEKRKMAQSLLAALKDVAATKNMTLGQLMGG